MDPINRIGSAWTVGGRISEETITANAVKPQPRLVPIGDVNNAKA